jgi:HAE1 family hydrophobic/amphiphilic exporter-1
LEKPVGVDYIWDKREWTEGFGTLGIALLAAIILVYLVMVSLRYVLHNLLVLFIFRFRLLSIISLGFDQYVEFFTILGWSC